MQKSYFANFYGKVVFLQMISHQTPGKSPKLGTPVRILNTKVAAMKLERNTESSTLAQKPEWDATVIKEEPKSRTNLKAQHLKNLRNLTPFTTKNDGLRNQLRDENDFKTPIFKLPKTVDYKAKYLEENQRNLVLLKRIADLEELLKRR